LKSGVISGKTFPINLTEPDNAKNENRLFTH